MDLFRQDIKNICLLAAYLQSLSSGQKTTNFRRYWQIMVKIVTRFIEGALKNLFSYFFWFDFLHIDPSNEFWFYRFFAKVSTMKERGCKLNFGLQNVKNGGGGQHNYRRCRRRHCLQSFVMMKTTV